MRERQTRKRAQEYHDDLRLIGKIYASFEALEETLGKLKLEEPLFITHVAKKSFAQIIFKETLKNHRNPKEKEEKAEETTH